MGRPVFFGASQSRKSNDDRGETKVKVDMDVRKNAVVRPRCRGRSVLGVMNALQQYECTVDMKHLRRCSDPVTKISS